MRYILDRTVLWWCLWDTLAAVILIAVCFYCYRKLHAMKKTVKELEERLEPQTAEAETAAASAQ